MPIGSSTGERIILPNVSHINKNKPPKTNTKGISFEFKGPITALIIWGTISPTKPIIPVKATE